MTLDEFSSQFDVLYNNALSNAAPGLDEYEKSVFLTKAQNEIVKNYFNPNGNKYKEGFDGSAKRQVDFNMLIRQNSATLTLSPPTAVLFDPRALLITFPEKAFIIINEQVEFYRRITNEDNTQTDKLDRVKTVVPIAYDEYSRIMSKPYKEPLKNQVWRLIMGTGTPLDSQVIDPEGAPSAEIIISTNDRNAYGSTNPSSPSAPGLIVYKLRYIKRPNPIILTDLSSIVGDVTIDGIAGPSSCELDPYIHEEILQRAVELAKAAYASDQSGQAQMQNQITVGQRSE